MTKEIKYMFQSTPPAREATYIYVIAFLNVTFQSTPPAREATKSERLRRSELMFQSTPPAREATFCAFQSFHKIHVSIHAPREGGDNHIAFAKIRKPGFNPRPPRGRRHIVSSF